MNVERWKKLTLPQRQLLWAAAERPHYVVERYSPRQRLASLELIEVQNGYTNLTPLGWVTLQPTWPVPRGWSFRASKVDGVCCVEVSHEDGRLIERRAEVFRKTLEALKLALETQ